MQLLGVSDTKYRLERNLCISTRENCAGSIQSYLTQVMMKPMSMTAAFIPAHVLPSVTKNGRRLGNIIVLDDSIHHFLVKYAIDRLIPKWIFHGIHFLHYKQQARWKMYLWGFFSNCFRMELAKGDELRFRTFLKDGSENIDFAICSYQDLENFRVALVV